MFSKNKNVLTSIWKVIKNMVDSGIWTRHLRLLKRGDTDTCIIQDTNCSDLNAARHGQFQEKEKNADY